MVLLLWLTSTCSCSKRALQLGPQELELVFAKLVPGTNTLVVQHGIDYISTEELDLLKKTGVTGELIIKGIDRRGEGHKKAHVLVVMSDYVKTPVVLRQPDATNAIYLQSGQTFTLLPASTPTIDKGVRLESRIYPMNTNQIETDYSIQMGSVTQGGTAFLW